SGSFPCDLYICRFRLVPLRPLYAGSASFQGDLKTYLLRQRDAVAATSIRRFQLVPLGPLYAGSDSFQGDLKTYLLRHSDAAADDSVLRRGLLLKMACDVAAGMQHVHERGFAHPDLAARSCLVAGDLTVKVGDYGISQDKYKGDYYNVGDFAVPIRWCAPETLSCSEYIVGQAGRGGRRKPTCGRLAWAELWEALMEF
ncbi:PREDICTED: putative neurotrophin receptor LTRK 1, partial [Priapulus caudatus]|uniref:Neurotrophin receptor LTRK 1 n=1 Tax=Priapulus caudatus TaxID=37621 RepID=A0ABM1F795_PRICU